MEEIIISAQEKRNGEPDRGKEMKRSVLMSRFHCLVEEIKRYEGEEKAMTFWKRR